MNQSIPFVFIDPNTGQLRQELDQLQGYESDKIKFMTKVEVIENRSEGIKSKIKRIKQPIYAKDDIIIFLLILQWHPNNVIPASKIRKGSFVTEKQLNVRVKFQKPLIEQEQLVSIVYLLSEKIYIEERHIDSFTKIIQSKHQSAHKHVNCLSVILSKDNSKRSLANMASTLDGTKAQPYWFDSTSYPNSAEQRNSQVTKIENYMSKIPIAKRNSSKLFQIGSPRSPRLSRLSREISAEETQRKPSIQFNQQKCKTFFSSIELLFTQNEVNPELIIFHLADSQNIIDSGFKVQTLKQLISCWPKYNSFNRLYKLNKEKIMQELIQSAENNYRLMVSMELAELNLVTIENIYTIINEFNNKIMNEFIKSAKQYSNQPDYPEYLRRLEISLQNLQIQLRSSYAQTKFQYGQRMLKNMQKKTTKNSIQSYTLMKIVGQQQINNLEIGYKMYKDLIEKLQLLDQGFKEFLTNKYHFKNKYHLFTENWEEEELNYVENRIQICQEKKKMLDSAIELERKQAESLKMMVKLMEIDEKKEFTNSEPVSN